MEENKNLQSLRQRLEKAQKELEQAKHQLQRKQNLIEKEEKRIRRDRTHRLIVRGADTEYFFPETKNFTEEEFREFLSKMKGGEN